MASVIAVIGASSRLGSSVVSALNTCPQFSVRVVSESVFDQADEKSCLGQLCAELNGIAGCLLCSPTDDVYTHDVAEADARRGRIVADACSRTNVPHVIYSSQLSVTDAIGIASRHMDVKADVEKYFKVKGVQLTSLIVTLTFEQFLVEPFRPIKIADGIFEIGKYLCSNATISHTRACVRERVHIYIHINRQKWL